MAVQFFSFHVHAFPVWLSTFNRFVECCRRTCLFTLQAEQRTSSHTHGKFLGERNLEHDHQWRNGSRTIWFQICCGIFPSRQEKTAWRALRLIHLKMWPLILQNISKINNVIDYIEGINLVPSGVFFVCGLFLYKL